MEDIAVLSLRIKSQTFGAGNRQQVFSLGPMLQSVLMEHVDSSYALGLHASVFNPYSQYCFVEENGEIVWRISALTSEAVDKLINPISAIETFELRNLNEVFSVEGRTCERFGMDFLLGALRKDAPSLFRIRFVSPSAFRSKGHYVFVPDVRLIFQNLLMRYNQVYSANAEIDMDTLEYVTEHVAITSYSLHSHYFQRTMGRSSKIPAFMGSLALRVTGPQPIRGLVAMLLSFGEMAGVGIKTSMGMGGMQLLSNHLDGKREANGR